MNKETYEALKYVVELCEEAYPHETPKEIKMINDWIDEVAKEYAEEKPCSMFEFEGKPNDSGL